MVVLMRRIVFLIFSFIFFLNASENYTFLVKEYNKEIELEAKIISNIDLSTLNQTNKFII